VIEVAAFMCSHCNRKVTKTARAMKRHESVCSKNPALRRCVACRFYKGLDPDSAGEGEAYHEWIRINCTNPKFEGGGLPVKCHYSEACPGWQKK